MGNIQKVIDPNAPYIHVQKFVDESSEKISELVSSTKLNWTPFEFMTMSTCSMLASKHFDLVFALDIHWMLIAGIPVPLPYPFFGMIFDPADYLTFTLSIPAMPILGISEPISIPMGGSIYVNKRHKAATTTSVFGLVPPMMNHIGPLAMPPMGVNDGEVYFGSKTVIACGVEMSAGDCKVLTCWDPPFASMALPTNPRKGFKFPLALYNYPTSMKVLISSGAPVMVGGAKVPHEYTLAEMAMRLAAMIGMKALGKLFNKVGKLFNKLLKKMFGANNKLSKLLCKLGFDPVNLVTGEVVYDGIDFQLSGPIPVVWERSWSAFSEYTGMLGHGVNCSYDLRLKVDVRDNEGIGLILPDGRFKGFDLLLPGTSHFDRTEKVTLAFDGENYQLTDHQTRLKYHYKKGQTRDFEEHAVVKITNEDDFAIQLIYNSKGHLSQLIDTVGRKIYLSLDEKGRIVNVEAHHKGEVRQLVSYGYSDDGDMISITNALDQSTNIEYLNHLMTKKTDRNGQSFYWEYDSKKRCVHTWGDDGLLEGFLEFKKGHTLVRDSKGESTYYFDENNLITEIKDPLGNSQYFSYNEYFELISETDAEENTTFHTYDERGKRILTNLPNGGNPKWIYNEADYLEEIVDAEGKKQYYEYDKNGKLTELTKENGAKLHFFYNEKGLLSEVENEQELRTLLNYDDDFNLSQVQIDEQTYTIWKYDVWGRNTRIHMPDANAQELVYDELDRVTRIVGADTNVVNLKYNAYDEVVQAIDKHRDVRFTYTPLGSLKSRAEQGRKVFFHYDKDEDLKSIANEKGEYYRFKRNAAGHIIEESSFDGLKKQFDRNRNGNVVRIHRPEERWTEFEYDAAGNMIRAEYFDETFEVYDYDKNGNLLVAINQHTEVYLKRNAMGQVIEERQNGHTVQSEYDKTGKRTKLSSSLGADLQFEYDALGNTTGIAAQKEGKERWSATMKHNALGLEIEREFSNGLTVQNTYGRDGLLRSQQVKNKRSTQSRKAYTWDVNSRLTSIMDELKSGKSTFSHDAFGNLTGAHYEDGSYDYKIPDSVGNLYKTNGRNDRKYDTGSRLIKDEQFEYRYDEEGNLIEKTNGLNETWTYEWYGNGMLKTVIQNGNNITRFEYDALGRRTQKKSSKTKQLTRFVWDGNVPLHEWEYKLLDQPKSYIDELGKLVLNGHEPLSNMVTWVFNPETFVPTAKITENGTYSIITDHLGTPTEAYNESGEKIWSCQLDIYGKIRKLEGDRSLIPFKYQGQYEDVETGLCYNRFRYYSPESGTYISQDPIGLAGNNPNIYAYVHDSNGWVDPFGLAEHITFPKESLHPKAQDIYSIQPTGYHHTDKVALYESAGLKEGFDSSKWISHHLEYDPNTNTMRMQLVAIDAHKASHIGGVNDFETKHKVKYNTEAAANIAKGCN